MSDLEKMVIDELTKGVNNKRLFVVFRNGSQSVLVEIREIAERFGANFLSMGFEYNNYVLTMGLKGVRQMEQSNIKKLKFLVVKKDGKRLAVAKHKIISVKEMKERNTVGLLLQDVDENEEFTDIVVDDTFSNIMLQLEA